MRSVMRVLWGLVVCAGALMPADAVAQTVVEGHVGRGFFLDESAIEHSVFGVAARTYVASPLAIGGSLTHMRGPGHDRDWLVMGHMSLDILSKRTPRRVMPYVSLGAGLMRHTNQFGPRSFSHTGLAATLLAGARVRAGERWFIAPEAGVGLEAHTRIGVNIGVMR